MSEDFGMSSGIAGNQRLVHNANVNARINEPLRTEEMEKRDAAAGYAATGIPGRGRSTVRDLIGIIAEKINVLHQQVGLLEQAIDPVLDGHNDPHVTGMRSPVDQLGGANMASSPAPPPPPFHIVAQLEICRAALDVIETRINTMQRRLVL